MYPITVEPVYCGQPWDLLKWSGDLIIQLGFYVISWMEANLGLELVAVIE